MEGEPLFYAAYTIEVEGGLRQIKTYGISMSLQYDYEQLVISLDERLPTDIEFFEWLEKQ